MPSSNSLLGNGAISVQWLFDHMDDEDVVVFDCRCDIVDTSTGKEMYRRGHIPGSFFLDIENDLSGPKAKHGGRHPLPDPVKFAIKMGKSGVDEKKTVIAYDEYGFAATRLWWLLKYYGHDNVLVLEGGIREWINQGGELSTDEPEPLDTKFTPHLRNNMAFSRSQVKENIDRMILIDSRSHDRYIGKYEPIDFKEGHIPGAINIDFTSTFSSPSGWKDRDELSNIFKEIGSIPIVYCGSGVTATANIFAMAKVGIPSILYAGGWSDWISYERAEIELGDPYKKESLSFLNILE